MNEPKEIGHNALVSKVLCKTHNEELSPVDAEAGRAFHAIKDIMKIESVRSRLPRKPPTWSVRHHTFNGLLLERWFLKTAINLTCVGDLKSLWPTDRSGMHVPSTDLVKAAFGMVPLRYPRGLYVAALVGQSLEDEDRLRFESLRTTSNPVAACVYRFRGLKFVLWLLDEPVPRGIATNQGIAKLATESWFRCRQTVIRLAIANRLSQCIRFE